MPNLMRQRRATATALAAVVFALSPGVVRAQPPAVAAKSVNLRAGPGRDYPLVLRVGAGTPLAVQGCTAGYAWCDVVVPGSYRGWVYAGNISYAYRQQRVPLLEYGAAIGLPIIGFSLGSYWGDYYRNRPFYRDRDRWEHRPTPYGGGVAGPAFGKGGDRGPRPDPGRAGGARPEAGRPDDGRLQGGRPDNGRPERGRQEGGRQEGGRAEGGQPNGGRTDGSPRVGGGVRPDGDRGDQGGRNRGGGDQGGGGRPGGDPGGGRGDGRPGR